MQIYIFLNNSYARNIMITSSSKILHIFARLNSSQIEFFQKI